MKRILLCSGLAAALIISSPALTFAGHGKSGCEMCAKSSYCAKCKEKAKECKVTKLKAKLKPLWKNKDEFRISDEQLKQIKAIKHDAIKKLIRLNADKEIVMVDLKSALYEDTYDLGAINAMIDAKYAAKKNAAKVFVKAIGDVKNVLNKDQKVKWSEHLKKAEMLSKMCPKCAAKMGGKYCPITGKKLKKK